MAPYARSLTPPSTAWRSVVASPDSTTAGWFPFPPLHITRNGTRPTVAPNFRSASNPPDPWQPYVRYIPILSRDEPPRITRAGATPPRPCPLATLHLPLPRPLATENHPKIPSTLAARRRPRPDFAILGYIAGQRSRKRYLFSWPRARSLCMVRAAAFCDPQPVGLRAPACTVPGTGLAPESLSRAPVMPVIPGAISRPSEDPI